VDKQKRYETTEKGIEARARSRAKQQAKREAARESGEKTVPKSRKAECLPVPKKFVKDKYAFLDETNSRLYKHLCDKRDAGEVSGMACVEFLGRWGNQWRDMWESDLKIVMLDPRTTDEEKQMVDRTLAGVMERDKMMALWLSKKETREQRIYRLAHKMFLDDSDPDFLTELLLGKLSNEEKP
jgi:hypothetical protein